MKHSPYRQLITLALSTVFTFFITGCSQARITPQPINERVINLANTNNIPIILDYQTNLSEESLPLGHQYGFFFLPLGQIALIRQNDVIFNAIFSELTLNGFKPLAETDLENSNISVKRAKIQKLSVRIKEASTSAFDYFFLRNLTSHITLEAKLSTLDNSLVHIWQNKAEASIWKEFGFEPQLNFVFNKALSQAVQDLIPVVKHYQKLRNK